MMALVLGRVDVAGVGLDVDKHRLAAEQHDHLGRGCEGEGRGDDFIARLQAQCHQADQQRFGAASHRDAVLGARVGGELVFKLLDLGAHDVLAVVEHALNARVDGFAQRRILRLEVDELDQNRSFGCIHGCVAGSCVGMANGRSVSVTTPPCST
jgi:hypothetical protein